MENFDFIGITQYYEDDLAYFGERFMGVRLKTERLNTDRTGPTPAAIDGALRRRIEKFHEADVELYRRALELRQARGLGVPPA